MKNDVISKD